jgi:hypothetical protein
MTGARRPAAGNPASRCQSLEPEYAPGQSVVDRETLPDLIDPSVEGIEAGVKAFVMQVKYISGRRKSENPVVRLHVEDHLLDRVADSNGNVPQSAHRIPR